MSKNIKHTYLGKRDLFSEYLVFCQCYIWRALGFKLGGSYARWGYHGGISPALFIGLERKEKAGGIQQKHNNGGGKGVCVICCLGKGRFFAR